MRAIARMVRTTTTSPFRDTVSELTDRGVQAGEGARLRPAHPSAVNPKKHFERRVAEHGRDVLRRVGLFEREPCECVPALVDDSRPYLGLAQYPRPVARAEVGEVDCRAGL
jgi:hypothetical protein